MLEESLATGRSAVAIPEHLPVLPLRDIVVYPFVTVSLSVSRPKSIRALDAALAESQMAALISQREIELQDPDQDDLYDVGTVAIVLRKIKLPDERVRILVQGLCRVAVEGVRSQDDYLEARVRRLEEIEASPTGSIELEALLRSVTGNLQRLVTLGKNVPADALLVASNLKEPGRLADLAASHLDLKVVDAQAVLEMLDPMSRLRKVNELLSREIELRFMQKEITNQAREEMGRSQREYFLRQQLKAIQKELGEGSEIQEEVAQLREKARERQMPPEALAELERAASKLERLHPESAEVASLRTYLEWMTSLPWGVATKDSLDLAEARRILDEDHFGLDPIKERIIEHLAVRMLRQRGDAGRPKGPLLCFVGPPGVGKTSLGRSIARALGRKFLWLSLGGVRDEAEIRGHRRTYVGAMPGRIIQGLRQCGSANPVFMLDEVDKIGVDARGDPAAALLEVLDPEQNSAFRDHYLGVPFDLSDVLFIATANLLEPIHPAFRDRMEVIRLAGYTDEEKLAIARRFLLPRQIRECGIPDATLEVRPAALLRLIHRYTREAGLRNLEREIGSVCRKVAKEIAMGRTRRTTVTPQRLRRLLGPERYLEDELLPNDRVGVATGLGLTASGGEVLFVETTLMKGHGSLILTGQLGEVMKESAQAALSYTRAHAAELRIRPDLFGASDLHVHLPSGATPKDGPSAGVTLVTSLISALSGIPVDRTVAMTGEITLRGEVLAVGGLKEKVLAARRAKARTVVLPDRNAKDLSEIPREILRDLAIRPVANIWEALQIALRRMPGEPARPRSSRAPGAGGARASARRT